MKINLLSLLLVAVLPMATFAQATLYSQDFEGTDFDTYQLYDGAANPIAFTPIATDYIAKGTPGGFPFGNTTTGFSGNIVACEDYDGAGVFGIPYLQTDLFSIAGYTNLTLSIRFAAPRGSDGFIYESSDFVRVEYRIDATPWQQAHFFGGSNNGRCYYDALDNGITGSGDDVPTNQNSQVFLESLSGTGSNLRLRIYFGSQGAHEEFAIDDILVQGSLPCNDPDVPVITATPTTVCDGDTVTLDWTGANLNDATQWHVYSGSCGGTLIDSTASNTLVVTPTLPSTTYYIRGEDGTGCVDELTGVCDSITIQVNTIDNPSFGYGANDYCPNDANPTPTITGTQGGAFAATPVGLVIDGSTGEIDLASSQQGTYTITYTTAGPCPDSSTTTITIADLVPPIANCQNITAYLDGNGMATITAAAIDNGSTDNCGTPTLQLSQTSFTCNDLGINTVTLTVEDANGNSSTCNATVTVLDTIAPVAQCNNLTVYLDVNGNASITEADIDNGSTDNCGAPTLSVSTTTFSCADIGANTVTLTASDFSNTTTCTATVTVLDTIAPTIVCPPDVSICDSLVVYTLPVGVDNCSGAITMQSDGSGYSSGDAFPVGTTTQEYTVTDVAGNIAVCSFTITVHPETDATFSTVQNGNDASFTANHQSGTATYFWDFGDGNTSTQTNPTHTYTNGSYIACLTVSENGCDATWCDTLDFSVAVGELFQNDVALTSFPNPFNGTTNISYQLNTNSRVTLRVLDMQGRTLAQLADGMQAAGNHRYLFDATESGIYLVQLMVDNRIYTHRLVKL